MYDSFGMYSYALNQSNCSCRMDGRGGGRGEGRREGGGVGRTNARVVFGRECVAGTLRDLNVVFCKRFL